MNWTEATKCGVGGVQCALCKQKPRYIDKKLTEEDILYLQDILLKNRLNHICFSDVKTGRDVMNILLQALNYYNSVACLSVTKDVPLCVHDMYADLLADSIESEDEVAAFFLESFEYDCMWVEMTKEFMQKPLMVSIVQILHSVAADAHLPIVAISYI